MPRSRAASCLSLFLLTGCGAGWHRVEATPDAPLARHAQYLVHHGPAVERWHAVRITADSVSGVSWLHAVECDSCRMALPRSAVDSISLGHPVAGVWKSFFLVTIGPFIALSVICAVTGDGCFPSD